MQFFIIAFGATTLGAIAGIGGGVIIRPLLSVLQIAKGLASFTSSVTVFVMTIVNSIAGKRRGAKIRLNGTVVLAAGSIAGAFAGAAALGYIDAFVLNVAFVFVLLLVICIVLLHKKIPPCKSTNPLLQLFAGCITGFLSGLFGIGGGPFQMAALLLLFRLEPREAALQSTFITFLTTAAALVQYGINGFFDFSICIYTIPGGILGGLAGSYISKKLRQSHILIIFCLTIFAVLLNQIYVVLTY